MKNIMADKDKDLLKPPTANTSVFIPFKYGTFLGHQMMWDSFESDDAVAPLYFESNLYRNPSEVSYLKSFPHLKKRGC